MAARVNRGEIRRLHLAHPDKRRPVLIVSRPSLIPLLHTVTVAAVTSTLRVRRPRWPSASKKV